LIQKLFTSLGTIYACSVSAVADNERHHYEVDFGNVRAPVYQSLSAALPTDATLESFAFDKPLFSAKTLGQNIFHMTFQTGVMSL
jgi:hypothetical protein